MQLFNKLVHNKGLMMTL